ncbi:MAG TPA: NAD(P)H-binding protein [Actinomycetota bacterium]|nr:NAD(P)H-binding protein [Actinomycetota bacterium]
MRIAVFGGTGRTGRPLVQEALERGHEVVALVRRAEHDLPGEVEVVRGDAREAGPVAHVVDGADAVVSVLAIEAGTEATTELSDATRTIADAMGDEGVRRLVVTANSTVFTDREVKDPFRVVAEEHRRNVAMLRGTTLAWTVVAPAMLRDGEPGELEVVVDAKATGREMSRRCLASTVLDAIDRDAWIGHVLGVADPPSPRAGA